MQAGRAGEFARLNMPFELGVDYGFRRAGGAFETKRALVIATGQYSYQVALSDIAGFDVRSHGNDYVKAIRQVRAWLRSHGLPVRGPSRIIGDYTAFQEWDFERLLAAGWGEADIKERSTPELFDAMATWITEGRPMSGPS